MNNKKIDWMVTFIPLVLILGISALFFIVPDRANDVLSKVRYFFGDTFGSYYLLIGLGMFVFSIYLCFSKYGNVVLGNVEKPKYSFFTWGSMMFTCGLAADILFYSFSEWMMYAADAHLEEMGSIQEWAGVFPLFHWSLIPWAFYLVLAVAFGYMLHVRKVNRQRYSEACRTVLGKKADGVWGSIIDLLAVFALLAGTATTFSVSTPLISAILVDLFGINFNRNIITIIILVITCIIYTSFLLNGFKGIGLLAKICIGLFFGLLTYVLVLGGQAKYILETGFESLGRMFGNFIELSTFTDPLRTTSFPQNWTIYYWAYWIVWCVAAPFFIGNISQGRTIRQTIMGGYIFGVGSTLVSFVVLGNYSMGLQTKGIHDFLAKYIGGEDIYTLIIDVIKSMPGSTFVMILLLLTMLAFYSTSFDSIAYTAACYSYRSLKDGEEPAKIIQLMWCLLLIALPIALVFSDSSMSNLQSVSIVAAFPLSIVMVIIVIAFMKDMEKKYE